MDANDALKQFEPIVVKFAKQFACCGLEQEDLEQIGRLAVVESCAKWRVDGGANRATFAAQYVRNAMLKEIRAMRCSMRNVSAVAISLDEQREGRSFHEEIGREATQEADLTRAQNCADVLHAIATLPERQQEIVRLKMDDFDVRTIGRMLGISKSRVDQEYQSALATLRARLMRGIRVA